jgi:predicted dehydrogenase
VHTGIEAEDTIVASLRFPHGALGTIEASTALFPGFSRRIEICGEHGSAVLEENRITAWKFRESRPEDEAVLLADGENSLGSGAGRPDQISYYGHLAQIQDFIDALRGQRAPAVSGLDARNAVSIIRAVYDSAGSGRAVML